MNPSLLLGSCAVVSALVALWWALSGPRSSRATIDLGGAGRPAVSDLHVATLQHGVGVRAVQPFITRVGRLAGRHTPHGRIAALEQRLLLAGTPRGWTMERVLAAKALFAAAALALGVLRFAASPSAIGILLALAFTAFGFLTPDLLLKNKADKRKKLIQRALADTVDQLTVSVQSGLGLDAAIARVARTTEGPLASEMARVVQDTRAGMRRSDALNAMTERVQLPELRHLVVALTQAEKLGVPIARTMQVQSQELRIKRRQHAEEQAMKLPVKLLFPMVLCILPSLFIVVLGPAAMNIFEVLGKG